jgi:hypothetical protein
MSFTHHYDYTAYNPNSLRLDPSLMQGHGTHAYTHSQYTMMTPTGSEWSSYPNSPSYGPADPYAMQHARSYSGSFSTYPVVIGSVPNNENHVNAVIKPVEGKKYRHDPYASGSEQSTPPCSPITQASSHAMMAMENYAALPGPAAPVYDPAYVDMGPTVTHTVANTLEDQFAGLIGNIAPTACTARGRTLILNIIRLQHLDKIQIIFEELCANLMMVLTDGQGCHVLRFLVDYMQPSHVDHLMNTLTPELTYQLCTHSQHSRRVLQCLVEQHKTPALEPLINILCHNRLGVEVAKTQQGCIAIMRILENVLPQLKERLFYSLAPSFPELSTDQFGNYAVQTAVQQFDPYFLNMTFQDVFYGQFVRVACNKFGSNVMEKIIASSCPELLAVLLNQLVYTEANLHKLMQDGFGNFVLQALVEASANTIEGKKVCDAIRPHLHTSPYGHKIEGKLRSKRLLTSGFNDANIRGNASCASSHSSDSH